MPRSTRVLFLLLLLPALCCAPKPAAKSPQMARRELVEAIELETVAMVHWMDDQTGALVPPGTERSTMRAYCTGVWLTDRDFVTAAHCPEGELHLDVQTRGDVATDTWRAAELVRLRALQDLAIVRVNGTPPPHPVAHFSTAAVAPGDLLHVVGHVIGQRWTYCQAVVSAIRLQEPDADGDPVDTLQVAGPIWSGDSGAGGFDEEGGLVGIVSYVRQGAPFLAYLIDGRVVHEFVGNPGSR